MSDWIEELNERSKDDRAIIVGSEVRALVGEIERLRSALRSVIENDGTRYDHHQPRRSDGKKPRELGSGTIWLTPEEIATRALRSPTPEVRP